MTETFFSVDSTVHCPLPLLSHFHVKKTPIQLYLNNMYATRLTRIYMPEENAQDSTIHQCSSNKIC